MSQAEEPSIFEYARFHGLIRDPEEDDPIHTLYDLPRLDDSEDEPDEWIPIPELQAKSKEKFTYGKESVALLASVANGWKEKPILENVYERIRDLKLELPLLKTDPDDDLEEFCRPLSPDLANLTLPLQEVVEDSTDDDADWLSKSFDIDAPTLHDLCREKLKIPRDTIAFLQSIRNRITADQKPEIAVEPLSSSLKDFLEGPPTPLLSPLSPDLCPTSLPSFDLQLDAENLGGKVGEECSERIDGEPISNPQSSLDGNMNNGHNDEQSSSTIGISCPCQSPSSDVEESSEVQTLKEPGEYRQTGVPPLTALDTEKRPPHEPDFTHKSEDVLVGLSSRASTTDEPEEVSARDIDDFFEGGVVPAADTEDVLFLTRGEGISASTERRPGLDVAEKFNAPHPEFSRDTEIESQLELGFLDCQHLQSDIADSSAKNYNITVPPDIEECSERAGYTTEAANVDLGSPNIRCNIDAFIPRTDVSNVVDSAWKPERLTIPGEIKSDHEQPGPATPLLKNIHNKGLSKKRLQGYGIGDNLPAKCRNRKAMDEDPNFQERNEVRTNDSISLTKSSKRDRETETMNSLPGQNFSALHALDNFVSVRKGTQKRLKVTGSTISVASSTERICTTPGPDAKLPTLPSSPLEVPSSTLPQVIVPSTPRPFVVSSTFLNQRRLSHRVRQIYPSAMLVERDFSLHMKLLSEQSQQSEVGTLADDAMIILSPAVGLMWTTVAKLRQRALPGQASRSSIRDMISRIAPRYENLIVLISEGSHREDNTYPIAETMMHTRNRDYETLIEFAGFCCGAEAEVETIYVSGGEKELADWIVSLMTKYSLCDPTIKLLHEETYWEIFLRRAGLNAFAAQVVLAELKSRDSPGDGCMKDHGKCGLPAFLSISEEERIARFEHRIGGTVLLNRVSKVLDAKW